MRDGFSHLFSGRRWTSHLENLRPKRKKVFVWVSQCTGIQKKLLTSYLFCFTILFIRSSRIVDDPGANRINVLMLTLQADAC